MAKTTTKQALKDARPSKEETKATADQAKADKDNFEEGGASVTPNGEGTTKEYQIEHGKAPIQPGPYEDVDPEDAAAAKVNRGTGKGG